MPSRLIRLSMWAACFLWIAGCASSQHQTSTSPGAEGMAAESADPWASFPEAAPLSPEDLAQQGLGLGANPYGNMNAPASQPLNIELAVEEKDYGYRLDVGQVPISSAAVVDGVAYFGGGWGDGRFFAVEATTGKTLWSVQTGDIGASPAVVSEGKVTFTTESCTLFVLDAKTGHQLWSQWLGDPLMGQPAVGDGKVFVVYPQQEAYALTARVLNSGSELWTTQIDSDILSKPVIAKDGHVYLTTQSGRVYKVDAESGDVAWARDVQATSAPWVDGLKVFVAQHTEAEHAVDSPREGITFLWADTGEDGVMRTMAWANHDAPWLVFDESSPRHAAQVALDSRAGTGAFQPATAVALESAAQNIGQKTVYGTWSYQGSRPVLANETLMTTMAGRLYALDPSTGDELWFRQLTEGALTPPAVAGHRVYTVSGEGALTVHDVKSGELLFEADIEEKVTAQPVIEDGRVFITTERGRVHVVDTGHRDGLAWQMWGQAGSEAF